MPQEQVSIVEFEKTLSETRVLCSQVREIVRIAASVSEKIQKRTQEYYDTSIKLAAFTIEGNLNKKRFVPSVKTGLLVSLGIATVGFFTSMYSNWRAKKEHEEALSRILAKKKEVAIVKLPFLEEVVPQLTSRMERISDVFFSHLKRPVILNNISSQETEQIFLQNIWLMFFELSLSISASQYVISEFKAWINNQQESSWTVPSGLEVKREALSRLLQESNCPEVLSEENVLNDFSQGAVFLIWKRSEFKEIKQYEEINDLAFFIANNYAWNQLFFIFKGRRFLTFFKNIFNNDSWINSISGFYLMTYYFYAVVVAYYLGEMLGSII